MSTKGRETIEDTEEECNVSHKNVQKKGLEAIGPYLKVTEIIS